MLEFAIGTLQGLGKDPSAIVEDRSFGHRRRGRWGEPEGEGERPALATIIRWCFGLRIMVPVVFGFTVVVMAEVDVKVEKPGAR